MGNKSFLNSIKIVTIAKALKINDVLFKKEPEDIQWMDEPVIVPYDGWCETKVVWSIEDLRLELRHAWEKSFGLWTPRTMRGFLYTEGALSIRVISTGDEIRDGFLIKDNVGLVRVLKYSDRNTKLCEIYNSLPEDVSLF